MTINGTSYSTCVKMESSTSIKVTVSGTVKVKLYFDGASKSFKVNGTSKTTGSAGTWSSTFTSGTLTITKGDSMNLFGIEISSASSAKVAAVEGIDEVESGSNAPVYNLSGQAVNNLVKGQVYIQNGVKFIAQ